MASCPKCGKHRIHKSKNTPRACPRCGPLGAPTEMTTLTSTLEITVTLHLSGELIPADKSVGDMVDNADELDITDIWVNGKSIMPCSSTEGDRFDDFMASLVIAVSEDAIADQLLADRP